MYLPLLACSLWLREVSSKSRALSTSPQACLSLIASFRPSISRQKRRHQVSALSGRAAGSPRGQFVTLCTESGALSSGKMNLPKTEVAEEAVDFPQVLFP